MIKAVALIRPAPLQGIYLIVPKGQRTVWFIITLCPCLIWAMCNIWANTWLILKHSHLQNISTTAKTHSHTYIFRYQNKWCCSNLADTPTNIMRPVRPVIYFILVSNTSQASMCIVGLCNPPRTCVPRPSQTHRKTFMLDDVEGSKAFATACERGAYGDPANTYTLRGFKWHARHLHYRFQHSLL